MENATLATSKVRGVKRHCLNCELPFYDLERSPIVCPNCGDRFKLEARIANKAAEQVPSGRYPAAHGLGGWASQRTPSKPARVGATESDGATESASSEKAEDAPDADDETNGALLLDDDTEIEDDSVPRNESDNQST